MTLNHQKQKGWTENLILVKNNFAIDFSKDGILLLQSLTNKQVHSQILD